MERYEQKERQYLLGEIKTRLKEYEERFSLKWPVRYIWKETETPRIVSSHDQVHRIYFSLSWARELEERLFDFVHELGHAHLAEKIDPIFSGTYFSRSYNEEDPEFVKKALFLNSAQSHVDVWVNDEVAKVDPKICKESIKSFIDSMKGILSKKEFLNRLLASHGRLYPAVAFSIDIAGTKRIGQEKKYKKAHQKILKDLEKRLGKDYREKTEKLAKYYSNLPNLPQEKEKALEILEKTTREVKNLLDLPIEPSLVCEEGHWVWRV